jgi:exopolysaccharide biosynthesis polyprenyl glycosylphosphotransferase
MSSLLTKSTTETRTAAPPRRRRGVWAGVWLVADAALVQLAFLLAYELRYSIQEVADEHWRPLDDFLSTRLLLALFIAAALAVKGAYRSGRATPFLDVAAGVAGGVTVGFALTIVAGVALRLPQDSRLVLVYAWALTVALLVAGRGLVRAGRAQLWRRGVGSERVVVVGAGAPARRLLQALAEQPHLGYQVVGFVDDTPGRDEWLIATQHRVVRAPRLGGCRDLGEVVRRHRVDEVIIALPSASHQQIMALVATCRARAVRFRLVPDLFELTFDQVQVEEVGGVPLLGLKASALSGGEALIKRAVDLALALVVLVVGAPLLGLIALAIKLDSPGPVLFRQVRVGKGGREFVCYKFRTMVADAEARLAEVRDRNEADGPLFKLRDDPRRTRVGRWLRRASLDEVAQVFNILRGEMSWVGPRPPVPAEVACYEEWHRQRLLVTPGVTGLWQVSGRSDLTFDEMVLLDLYYAEHWSLWLDLKILLRTIPAVLLARGAY